MPVPVLPEEMDQARRLVQGPKKVLQPENSRTVLTIAYPNKEARKLPQFLAAFTATLAALCAGTFFSWSSAVAGSVEKTLSKEAWSWVGSVIMLGAFCGSLMAGMAANKLGRQRTLLMLAVPLTVSWLLIATTSSLTCLLLGRSLAGLAIGAVSVVAGMYVSEVAEPSVRGTLGAFFQLQITVGYLLGTGLGMACSAVTLAYVSMALPLVYGALFWSMPESPVFLLTRGQSERARTALQWLRGPEYDVSEEIAAIRNSIMESSQTKASVKDLFASRAAVKGMVVALGLMAAQQLSGINAVMFNATDIFKKAGATNENVNAIIVAVVQVLSTFLSMVLADRAGRRVLLLLSSSIMAVCLATLATYFHLQEAGRPMHLTWLPLVAMAVFIVMFSLGLGPLPWCVVSEIFSPKVKGTAVSVACGSNWLMAFIVTKFFVSLQLAVNMSGAFYIFTCIAAAGTVFIAVLLPETKGKTLDVILGELTGSRTCPRAAADAVTPIQEEDEEAARKPFSL